MADQKDVYELTPTQRAMLLYAQAASASSAYFEQLSYEFQGPLNVPAFARAWRGVIDRHPVLRTSFYCEGGQQPVQVVHPKIELPLVEQDWRSLSGALQSERLALFLEEDRCRGFDLTRTPLIRLTLIRTNDESYHFVLSYHHIIMDGWSLWLVRSEVSQCYKASLSRGKIKLDPARGFSDYVEWLREQNEADSDLFWARELRGVVAPNELAVDRAPGAAPTLEISFGEREKRLPPWLTADLHSFAGRQRLTMSTLIQGAWALLLGRYCGADDVVFGVRVSGRPQALTGIESMVGLFINLQPRRVRICQTDLIWTYFKNLQAAVAVQGPHEHISLERIQLASGASQSLPLFESLVVFENFQAAALPLDLGAPMAVTGAHLTRTIYPLTLVAHPGSQLRLQLIYHRSRFTDQVIETILGDLAMMLEDIAENSDRTIESLALLEAAKQITLPVRSKANGQGSQTVPVARGFRVIPGDTRKASYRRH